MGRKNEETKAKKRRKKEHKVLKTIGKVLLIILLLLVSFVGGFLGYSIIKGNGVSLKGLAQTALGQTNEDVEKLEEFKVLILGVSEDISVALTDTIMVASYNPRTQKAVLLSIPRDTFVGNSKTSANSYDKINAIYQKEGAEGVLKKVNKLTGLDLEYYLVISNKALVELVDEIGGVEFDVPINMKYDSVNQNLHINLKKGVQKLNGKQAEWLVRFRKNNNGTTYPSEYGNDDYGRMKTQRDFIKAVAKQTLQAKNITKIGSLIDIVKRNVQTNITDWDLVKEYIPSAIEFNMKDLQTETIPGESTRIPAKTGLWFFLADEIKTKELVEEIYEEVESENEDETEKTSDSENINSSEKITEKVEISSKVKSNLKIEILNGSGETSKLTKVKKMLRENGYHVTETSKTSTTSKTTIINHTDVDKDVLTDLKSMLDDAIVSNIASNSNKIDITIIIGQD